MCVKRTESGVCFLLQENEKCLSHIGVTQLASHVGGNPGVGFFGAGKGESSSWGLPRLGAGYMVSSSIISQVMHQSEGQELSKKTLDQAGSRTTEWFGMGIVLGWWTPLFMPTWLGFDTVLRLWDETALTLAFNIVHQRLELVSKFSFLLYTRSLELSFI